MIDADVVTVDNGVFLAIGLKVSPDAREIRQRKGIQVVSRKGRKPAAARTIAQVVTGNRSAVWSEDRADRCVDWATAGELVITGGSWLQQLTEIAKTHSRRRHRHAQRIACAAKDRSAVSLAVQWEEEERSVATVIPGLTTFTEPRQKDWTTDRAVKVMRYVVGYRLWSRIVKLRRRSAQEAALIDLTCRPVKIVLTRFESRGDNAATGASGFSRRNARLNLKLGDCVRIRIDRDLSKLRLVVINAIEREVVVRRAGAVYNQNWTARLAKASCFGIVLAAAAGNKVAATTQQPEVRTRHARR